MTEAEKLALSSVDERRERIRRQIQDRGTDVRATHEVQIVAIARAKSWGFQPWCSCTWRGKTVYEKRYAEALEEGIDHEMRFDA